MSEVLTLNANVTWLFYKDRQSGNWIGVCEALNLTALGETTQDLNQAIFEAMDALFRDLLIEDELERYLYRRNWQLNGKFPVDPTADDVRFDIPIELIANGAHAGTHALPQ